MQKRFLPSAWKSFRGIAGGVRGEHNRARWRKLLFGSDRDNRTNLFGIDLQSGEITQLTDLDVPPPPAETSFLFAGKNPRWEEVYFWHGRALMALDLQSLAERVLYKAPTGFLPNITNVTADGRYVCTGLFEDLSGTFQIDWRADRS